MKKLQFHQSVASKFEVSTNMFGNTSPLYISNETTDMLDVCKFCLLQDKHKSRIVLIGKLFI
ncbi:hypothetical protein AXX17_AT5G00830 [Arabidopsis thaliana]|uniref:Uncharacterized protein n=1 Tax=Arabidopsis thaliana TaxID=3702 RepID=A0A178UPV0_ARATH|nr:hypothetical protein AXX17_AT5G00830 [Arabidopsis thaliana]